MIKFQSVKEINQLKLFSPESVKYQKTKTIRSKKSKLPKITLSLHNLTLSI
jgi:hypothetical protein